MTGKYDFLNRLLSLRRDGLAQICREENAFFQTQRYLDVACGTGDLSIAAAEMHPRISVTGLDFVPEMVAAAKNKVQKEKPFRTNSNR